MKMVPGPPAATAAVVTSSSSSTHQQFQVTEDTPVDYLEGCMEILVVFPNEKSIPMSIQRRMPMLDLLIHVTAANKISPSGHVLQVTDGDGRLLSHKPSTPIGSLNAHTVYIVAKNRLQGSGVGDRSTSRANNNGGGGGGAHQQFQPSFRLQVRLPRNQLFVTRVTGRTLLADLLRTVCEEKDLDPRLYELRHPVNLDERLRLSSCIDDYKLQEVVVVLASTGGGGGLQQQQSVHDLPPTVNSKKSLVTVTSSSNTMNINSSKSGLRSNHSSDSTLNHGSVGGEKKKRGLFGLFGFGRNNKKGSSMGDSSISSDSAGDRSISPTRSDEPQPSVAEPVTVRQPSPVLVSKRLAEEAVAKRNSRLSQLTAAENVSSPATPIINGSAKGPAPRAGPKKRMAPAPPPSTLAINDRNSGNSKAPSEVSTASSSNSPAVLVRKKPDQSTSHRTPSPIQTEPIQRRPMNQAKSAEPAESSPTRTQSASNLLSSSPNLSSSNLTTVSSTSNASLASAVKKRKAPVPPQPVVVEQAESMTTISAVVATTTEATAAAATTTTNGHVRDDVEEDEDVKSEQQQEPQHDDMDDRMSAVSSSIASSEIGIGGVINRSVAGSESLSPSPPPLPAIEPPDEQTRDVGGVRKERMAANNQNGSLDDDYEVLNYPKKTNSTDPVAVVAAMNGARQREEMLASEPIYTMVIKTPPVSIRAVVQEKVEMDIVTTSSPMLSDEMDHEDEREVERDAGDGQTESPILWEYKLPAPPTPFQDSLISSVKSLPLVAETTVTESSGRSRMSSMSVDSLQDGGRSSDEDEDQSRSPLTPRTDSGVCVKVTLFSGSELLGESITDCLETSSTDEAVKEPPVVMVLKDAQLESTTDEPLSLNSSAPASLPPLPSTSPPSYSDEEENEADSDSMRFSISTYRRRAEEDSHYDHKMATNSNSNAEKDPVAEVKVPASSETKEPETTVDGTASTAVEIRGSGNGESATTTTAAATPALLVPVMNLDLIQQFQAALHTIADPQARALQEEFLRLQQQFLTLQLQATAHQQQTQQNNSQVSVQQQQTNESGDQEETGSAPSSLIVQEVKHERSESVDNSPKDRIHRTEEETVTPVPDEVDEPVVYRYTGPPQVKMETWKPGRPRSEVMDYSRSSSFNVPLAKKEVVKKATPVPAPILTVEASSSITPQPPTPPPPPPTPPAIEAPLPVQEEVVLAPVIEEVVKSREEVKVEVVEGLSVREKVDQVESSNGNKPAVMRKSSFLTARPFEANRPVSMPIKRPNFTPMVIQPVPFVSRKIRAPEVRGFASLPYVDLESTSKTPRNSTPSPTTESTMLPSSSKGRWVAQASQENPTIVIRNKLIESARRPSAELNGPPLKTTEDSSNQVDAGSEDAKESRVDVETTRVKTTPSSGQPLAMPTSSSLLLAASANANATKRQTFSAAEAPSVDKMQVASSGAVNNSKANNDAPARRSLSSKFVRRVDPREELLNSIRDFANGGGLKKTGVNIN